MLFVQPKFGTLYRYISGVHFCQVIVDHDLTIHKTLLFFNGIWVEFQKKTCVLWARAGCAKVHFFAPAYF